MAAIHREQDRMWLLKYVLGRNIRKGSLILHDADGGRHLFGGREPGPKVTMRFHDRTLHRRFALNPGLAAGEGYMDGTLTFEDGSSVDDFVDLIAANRKALAGQPGQRLLQTVWRRLRRLQQHNPITRSAGHAQHHYDLSEDLFRLFLDSSMNYSCAYWIDPERESLEQAQQNKMRHVAAKMGLKPGMRVLEIGSGWGGLAIYLAQNFDVQVTAANVATQQLSTSRRRADEAGVADRIEFVEKDYREIDGRFDRIVSIAMLEHVGAAYLDTYFRKVGELLAPGGSALIHAGGRMNPPGTTGPFVRKYIFPGGYAPSLSEVLAATERTGLLVCDLEVLHLHYTWTLREWQRRFRANRERVVALYDERFYRMWEFYLVAAEEYFRTGNNMIFQLLLSTERDAVPIRRDYMIEAERALAAKEQRAYA
jgi:cyclopropane-fatty-acyl-phospholipid synthase